MKRLTPPVLVAACLLALTAIPFGRSAAPPSEPTAAERAALKIDAALIGQVSKADLMGNLTYLSDVIGPRLTGSKQLKRANDWTAERMKSYGLTNVRLEPWVISEAWERGFARARVVEPNTNREISLASLAWRPGTKGKVVGDVIALNVKTMKELEAYKGKLKNAIILPSPPLPVPAAQIEWPGGLKGGEGGFGGRRGGFGGGGVPAEARDAFLLKEGAAAVLQCSFKPLGLITTGGRWGDRDRASAENRMPTLQVAHNHYAMLYRLATRGDGTKAGADAPRTRLEIEVQNKFIPGPVKVFNTVGEIRGSEKPDEFVVIGAHLDSWDLGQGTTDNGTGSSIVLEVARTIMKSGVKPKRTIRFVLFSGEEQGLHGSRAYVQQHKDEMARTSACLCHDIGTGKVIGLGAGNFPKMVPTLRREMVSLVPLGVTNYERRSIGGSDHASFTRAGVPGFLMVQESAGYYLSHHTQADTMDRVRPNDIVQGAQVLAVAAVRIANLDELLPRVTPAGKRGRE